MRARLSWATQVEDNPFALSIGDMMAALLMVFVLLLAATLLQLEESFQDERQRAETIQEITQEYESIQKKLYEALDSEFKDDLPKWSAVLDKKELSIRFKSPDVLFASGRSEVRQDFKNILNSFFPRYIQILESPDFKPHITEIRIEGHTSTEWSDGTPFNQAYFLNMELSQDRTRSVLQYSLEQIKNSVSREWARKLVTANGLSSSKPCFTDGSCENINTQAQGKNNKTEDKAMSRRVEFRVRTDAEKRIQDILEKSFSQTKE